MGSEAESSQTNEGAGAREHEAEAFGGGAISHDEKEKLKDTKQDKTVAKSSEASDGNNEPRRVIIATMPKFKKRRPEPS